MIVGGGAGGAGGLVVVEGMVVAGGAHVVVVAGGSASVSTVGSSAAKTGPMAAVTATKADRLMPPVAARVAIAFRRFFPFGFGRTPWG